MQKTTTYVQVIQDDDEILLDPKGHTLLTIVGKSIDVIAMYKVGLYILHTTNSLPNKLQSSMNLKLKSGVSGAQVCSTWEDDVLKTWIFRRE